MQNGGGCKVVSRVCTLGALIWRLFSVFAQIVASHCDWHLRILEGMAIQGHPFGVRDWDASDGTAWSARPSLGPSHKQHAQGLHVCSLFPQWRALPTVATTPVQFASSLTASRPPFQPPSSVINHKRPYDSSATCHLVTKVQPTYETCHSYPFTQKLKHQLAFKDFHEHFFPF